MRIARHFMALRHLFRIFGTRFFWVWIKIRVQKIPKLRLPLTRKQLLIRSGTSDEQLLYQIFSNKQYHIKTDRCETIIDLGANIGLASAYLANLYPKARIVCIEPDEGNFSLLKENMKQCSNAICYQAAIGSEEGSAITISKPDSEPWAIRTKPVQDGDIPILPMEKILSECGISQIDILKIDIEGAELDLFSKNYHSWLSRVNLIVIELHEHLSPGCGQQFFKAVSGTFENYHVSIKGSNLVVRKK